MNRFLRATVFVMTVSLLLPAGCDRSGKTKPNHSATDRGAPKASPVPSDHLVEVPNPLYASWADFPVGTTVIIRDVHEHAGNRTASIKTLKLVEKTSDMAVVEEQITTTYPDGRKEENPVMRHEHGRIARVPEGTDPKSLGRGGKPLEEGTEKLRTPIGDLETSWYTFKGRVEAGEILHKVWTSPAVPGGTVKVESRVPALTSLTVLEVIEVRRPNMP